MRNQRSLLERLGRVNRLYDLQVSILGEKTITTKENRIQNCGDSLQQENILEH